MTFQIIPYDGISAIIREQRTFCLGRYRATRYIGLGEGYRAVFAGILFVTGRFTRNGKRRCSKNVGNDTYEVGSKELEVIFSVPALIDSFTVVQRAGTKKERLRVWWH